MHVIVQMGSTVFLSLFGATMLKLSNGFANLEPTLLFLVSYSFAFYFFSLALRTLPLSVGYAIWSGFSTAGNALVGHFYFYETLTGAHIVTLAIIIIGIVLINNGRIQQQEIK